MGKWLPRFNIKKKNREERNKVFVRDGKKNGRGLYRTNADATMLRSYQEVEERERRKGI